MEEVTVENGSITRCRLLQTGELVLTPFTIDGHCNINRLNSLIAVRHLEGHVVEVGVRVGELALGETHVGGTGIRAGGRGRAAEREVVLGVERRRDVGDHIVLNRVRRTVIIMGGMVTGNRHGSVHLVDGEAAVGDMEHHVVEITVVVGELRFGKTHREDAGIDAGHHRVTREREIVLGVSFTRIGVHNLHIIASHGVLLRVVVGGGGMTGDVHNHGSCRHNLQLTVGSEHEGHVVIRVVVREVVHIEVHAIRLNFGGTSLAAGRCVTAVRHIRNVVVAVAGHGRVARHRLRGAVIDLHGGITRDGHRDIGRQDGQLGRIIRNVVVALGSSAARGDDIRTHTLARHATHHVGDDILGIAVLQAGHRRGESRIRRAEVLGLGIGLHRHIRGGDGERGRHVGHIVVTLHRRARRRDRILADSLTGSTADGVSDDACRITILQSGHRRGEGRIICAIDFRLSGSGNGSGSAGDGQLTDVLIIHIVVGQCITRSGDQIVTNRLALLAAKLQIQQVADGLFIVVVHQTGDRSGKCRVGFAVYLGLVLGRHGQRGLRHMDRHNHLLLTAVRGLGAGSREGHGMVTLCGRSAVELVLGGVVGETLGQCGVRQRSMVAEGEHHRGDFLTIDNVLGEVVHVIHSKLDFGIDRNRKLDRLARHTADTAIRVGRGHRERGLLHGGLGVRQGGCRDAGDTRSTFRKTCDMLRVGARPVVSHRTASDRSAELNSGDKAVATDSLVCRRVHHHGRVHRHGNGEGRTLTGVTRGRGDGIDGILDRIGGIAQRTAANRVLRSSSRHTAGNTPRRSLPLVGGGIVPKDRSHGKGIEGGAAADVVGVGDVGELEVRRGEVGAVERQIESFGDGTTFVHSIPRPNGNRMRTSLQLIVYFVIISKPCTMRSSIERHSNQRHSSTTCHSCRNRTTATCTTVRSVGQLYRRRRIYSNGTFQSIRATTFKTFDRLVGSSNNKIIVCFRGSKLFRRRTGNQARRRVQSHTWRQERILERGICKGQLDVLN